MISNIVLHVNLHYQALPWLNRRRSEMPDHKGTYRRRQALLKRRRKHLLRYGQVIGLVLMVVTIAVLLTILFENPSTSNAATGPILNPARDSTNSRCQYRVGNASHKTPMPGVALYFLTITNNGPTTDVFDVTTAGTLAGWRASIHEDDSYLTPLVDTDNDDIVDTGAMAPGASKGIVVWISNPYDAADGTTDTATVTATSSEDTDKAASSTLSTTCSEIGAVNPERAGDCWGWLNMSDGTAHANGRLVICYNTATGEAINEISGPTGNTGTSGCWWAIPGGTPSGVHTGDVARLYFIELDGRYGGYTTVTLEDNGGTVRAEDVVEVALA